MSYQLLEKEYKILKRCPICNNKPKIRILNYTIISEGCFKKVMATVYNYEVEISCNCSVYNSDDVTYLKVGGSGDHHRDDTQDIIMNRRIEQWNRTVDWLTDAQRVISQSRYAKELDEET